MTIIADCPSCNRKLRVPEELLGKEVRCPTCGTTFTASGSSGEPSPPPARQPPEEEEKPWEEPLDEPAPPKRRVPSRERDEDFDDEDDDDRPWRRSGRRRDLQPHRGSLILVLGILSLVFLHIL